jgi:hypothetical protein
VRRIYIALGVYVALFIALESALGWAVVNGKIDPSWQRFHVIAGIFTGIFVCLVHSLIFIHLLGTGLGIKKAIDQLGLDEAPKAELRRFKMLCFPPAFLCMAIAIATAVTGGAVLARALDPGLHLALGGVLLVANVITFPFVARALGENERVLRAVEAAAAAKGAVA